jgi:hypothetical protein
MPEPVNSSSRPVDERARTVVPNNVGYRTFVTDTVALNIGTGQYHGLNATAGRMLEVGERRGAVAASGEPLAREFDQPADRIEADLPALCAGLHARGLLVVEDVNGR